MMYRYYDYRLIIVFNSIQLCSKIYDRYLDMPIKSDKNDFFFFELL